MCIKFLLKLCDVKTVLGVDQDGNGQNTVWKPLYFVVNNLLCFVSLIWLLSLLSVFFLFFALKGDNVVTKEQNQSYEPNKLVKVKVSAAIMFLAR